MLQLINGTIVYICFCAITRADEAAKEKAWKEAEEIDWNEYYASI